MIERLDKTTHANTRIAVLRNRIISAERYRNNNNDSVACKQLKEEMANLLKIEQERETLRKLPLYSSKITDFKWYCSKCYDEAYLSNSLKKDVKYEPRSMAGDS